ncbi:MAG: biopolymer transporter ExbD [Planctomycetes bacterium]|nr:biopolymer transporter ExbD [Planctomycetota bacterium]
MRLRTHSHQSMSVGKVNVTPLIDVVMVLIIFFLIVGQMAAEQGARVKLPTSASGRSDAVAGDRVVISVIAATTPAGLPAATIMVDRTQLSPRQLQDFLSTKLASASALNVIVRADRGLDYSLVQPTLDACRDAGVSSVNLIAERERGH